MASEDGVSIYSLPDEVITIILCDRGLNCKDVLNFSETCKQYNEMVKENQIIWKTKLKTKLPQRIGDVISSECKGNWLAEIRDYYLLRANIFRELMALCSKFYKQDTFMTLKDVEVFFTMASSRNINYFIVTSVLCEILRIGKYIVSGTLPGPRPYNLTDMYYAKIVLRYLIHAYLMMEWVINFKLNVRTPELVIHFIHQWIDTTRVHLVEDCFRKIQQLATLVEDRLDSQHPFRSVSQAQRDAWLNGQLPNNAWNRTDCRKVLAAVKQVLYDERNFRDQYPLNTANALDIVKAINTSFASPTLLAAIFSCLCRRFGVRCDLITFSDHMYLEWREDYDNPRTEMFTLNLSTGEFHIKRMCPYSQASRRSDYKYCPDNLLTHLYGTFIRSMGSVKTWGTENVYYLHEFLRTNHSVEDQGPYKNFMLFLMNIDEDVVQTPMSFRNMATKHLDVISLLVNMHRNREMKFKIIPKPHEGHILFPIGMVCYHIKHEYMCVLKGWDSECAASIEWQERMAVNTLENGAKQPYYQVIAADYSERYVAQENLRQMAAPNRQYHLEDVLAPEFSYFDGFAYIPNEMKELQYPTDRHVQELYKMKKIKPPSVI